MLCRGENMNIDSGNMLNAINAYRNDPVSGKDNVAVQQEKIQARQQDRVELSTRKTEIAELKKAVETMPDVRSEKVAALRQQISEGTYKVEGAKVAEKMLEQYKGKAEKRGSE
jgi:negative regulator of flagellin synthesis FlgM